MNGAPFVNAVPYAPMPRELADSDPSIDHRRYWPTVRNRASSNLEKDSSIECRIANWCLDVATTRAMNFSDFSLL
jgi:hypothetical protein